MTTAGDAAAAGAIVPARSDAAAAMPLGDWQFWAVTLAAIVAVAFILKPLLPGRPSTPPCGSCSQGDRRPRRTGLTIEGRPRAD
jgi:hypothetical protein